VKDYNSVRQPELYDLKELSKRLRTSKTTIRAWIRLFEDPLPAIQVRNKLLFEPDAVYAWLARHQVKPPREVTDVVKEILGDVN
jgi:excisionase family DNA binding protein